MANGRFSQYYWEIQTLLAEKGQLLDWDSPLNESSSDDDAYYAGLLNFKITFFDGSLLIAISSLREGPSIVEYNYYYGYRDANGVRVFSYDDRDHHPEISTHPHHMHRGQEPVAGESDPAFPCDLQTVNFFTIFHKVEREIE